MVHLNQESKSPQSTSNLVRQLKNTSLFKNLKDSELLVILGCSNSIIYDAQENIVFEQDKPDGFYLVLSGRLQMYVYRKNVGQPKKILGELTVGQHFGEIGLIDGEPRSASIEVLTESELLFLPTVKFIAMIQFHPLIAQAIVDNLIDLVLRLPNYKIKSENTRALLEKRLIKPDLESMQALCMAIRQNNKSAALT